MIKLILISSFLFTSCAQMNLKLADSEIKAYKEFSKAKKSAQTLGPISLSVSDVRGDVPPSQIGIGFTGVKYQKTPILLNEDLASYLTKKLTTEFTKRNVLVDEQANYKIEVLITKLSVDEFIEKHLPERARCEIEFQLKSSYLTKTFNARYWAEVISPGDLGDGTEKIAPTFASCINVITDKIVEDKKFNAYLK